MSTLLRDCLAFAGLALIVLGTWWLCPPVGLILAGIVLLLVALGAHHAAAKSAGRD